MTGPEHYCEAERLMVVGASMSADGLYSFESDAERFAAAQVHATLALVVATADDGDRDAETWAGWSAVIR